MILSVNCVSLWPDGGEKIVQNENFGRKSAKKLEKISLIKQMVYNDSTSQIRWYLQRFNIIRKVP
jgi:hypothetical protein